MTAAERDTIFALDAAHDAIHLIAGQLAEGVAYPRQRALLVEQLALAAAQVAALAGVDRPDEVPAVVPLHGPDAGGPLVRLYLTPQQGELHRRVLDAAGPLVRKYEEHRLRGWTRISIGALDDLAAAVQPDRWGAA